MNKLFGMLVLSTLLISSAAFAETAPSAPAAPTTETAKPAVEEHEKAVDTCGGAGNYMGLRILGKGETLAPGSRKVDVSKLPVGTRVFDGTKAHPQANGSDKDANPKRLNLIIDRRNVIAEAFCG